MLWSLFFVALFLISSTDHQNIGDHETFISGELQCKWSGEYNEKINGGWRYPSGNSYFVQGFACGNNHCAHQNMYWCQKREFPDGSMKGVVSDLADCHLTNWFTDNGLQHCNPGYGLVDKQCWGGDSIASLIGGGLCRQLRLKCCRIQGATTGPGRWSTWFWSSDQARMAICRNDELVVGVQCGWEKFCGNQRLSCAKVLPRTGRAAGRWAHVCSIHAGGGCSTTLKKGVTRTTSNSWTREDSSSITKTVESGLEMEGVGSAKVSLSTTHSMVKTVSQMMSRQENWETSCTADIGPSFHEKCKSPNNVLWQWQIGADEFNMRTCLHYATCSARFKPKCLPGCCQDLNCQYCQVDGECPAGVSPQKDGDCINSHTVCSEQSAGNGELTDLGGHVPRCAAGTMLAGFQFIRCDEDRRIQYKYRCCKHTASNAAVHQTQCSTQGAGNGELIYLDRHDISCPSNQALTEFQFQRCGTTNFRYHFKCASGVGSCSEHETACNAQGPSNGELIYLDRHNISCPANKVLQQFRFMRCNEDKGIHFKYRCCS